MKTWIIIIAVVLAVVIFLAARISYELKHPVITEYVIRTPKVSGVTRFVFFSDLHGKKYDGGNEKLLDMIRGVHPDYILIGGDLIVSRKEQYDIAAYDLMTKITRIAPAYLAFGNHEQTIKALADESGLHEYERRCSGLIKAANDSGVIILDNSKANIGEEFSVSGLSLDIKYYKKFKKEKLTKEEADSYFDIINRSSTGKDPAAAGDLTTAGTDISCGQVGKFDKNRYNIVLAHNPEFFREYAGGDRDLILSGHYHGGVMRIGGHGVISPDFKLFPKYSYGGFREKDTCLIVTSGIGSHSVNIRFFNRPEVVVVDICAEDQQK